MEETFERIRGQINSKLDNQKQISITLLAIEETIKEQDSPLNATSYFGALLITLEQQLVKKQQLLQQQPPPTTTTTKTTTTTTTTTTLVEENNNIIGSILYLLNIVLKELPANILKNKYFTILTIFSTSFENIENNNDSLILRSIVGCLETLLSVQDDINVWQQFQTKKIFQNLLILSIDNRPKPRKKVHDSIKKILFSISKNNDEKSLGKFKHPAIDMTVEFCMKILKDYIKTDQTSVLHILSIFKGIIGIWTTENLYSLCEILINIPKYNQKYLTVSSFQLFEILFQNNSKVQQRQQHRFKELLISLTDLMPNIKDVQLLPQWLMIIARGFPIYVECNKNESEMMLQEFFIKIFGILESDNSDIIVSATVCLCELVSSGITDNMIQKELNYIKSNHQVQRESCLNIIISTLENSFTFKYQNAWPGIFEIIKELFERFHKSSYPLLNNLLKIVTDIRMDKTFEFKEEADMVIGSAIENMGPKYLLNIIPLNLEINNNNNNNNNIGRAWLLPLLKDHIINSELGYFLKEFIPLSKRLQQKSLEFQKQNRLIESKIYDTLYQQIWSLLPGFCNLPIDLQKTFNKSTGELLSNTMYQQPDLRPIISLSLQKLVEKNKELLNSEKDDQELKKLLNIDKNDAKNNLDLISKHSNNYLAVFFNVLSETLPSFKNYLLEVIKVFLSITSLKDINNVYVKVINNLKQSLSNSQQQQQQHQQKNGKNIEAPPPMSHTMLDLTIVMTPYLNITSINQLYEIITNLIFKDDPILQKKSYKILKSLSETDDGKNVIIKNIEDLQIKLRDSTINTTSSSKKDRLLTLSNIIKLLPDTDLHMIPDILSEVILSTKEVNEKSRLAAYDLLIIMGNKMKNGGNIIMSKILESKESDNTSSSSSSSINANIDEFVFNMVIAGLAATTPHMISATITTLSRLLFEFKNDLNKDYIHKLIDTMNNFVNCTNREIVKSALGFVKVTTISLDLDIIKPHLNQIITGLLTWSNEHKSHFKVKVRHIFERLIRRFDYDTIEKFVPENDKKLLVNIKKRKERAKRKKIADESKMNIDNDNDDFDQNRKRSMFNNAYEDALYGSESDLEDTDDDDDDDDEILKKRKKKDGKSVASWIKEGDDDDDYTPVDFLDKGIISKVIGVNPSKTRKQRKDFSKAFKETRDGKMVINESDDSDDSDDSDNASDIVMQEADDNYTESQKSNDGFTRGRGNKIKFKKGNKKNNDDDECDNMDIDDIEPIDAIASRNQKKRKNKVKNNNNKVLPIGKEYKAKNAGGDIKKKGKPDPYAYVSLSSVYKGKRHNQQKGPKVSITSKSKIQKRQGIKKRK
ncbi:NUC173-domain-containing protein [Rhizophagus irregularis]|uniref:NUC173-domain-containing protein n=1 Tax=Rhizophagus irregularis TaxID=588596 RepID=A0A2N1MTT1_9GLOM|nr:NUC173-domain-containing protein [Rhizophagus irregularis]